MLAEDCGFVIMTKNQGMGKYELMGQLKTWSAYKREQVRKHRDEDREGKRGVGREGTVAALGDRKQLVAVMATRACIHTAAAAAASAMREEYRHRDQ